jgi:uncharacterized protein (TIGR00251 family)
MLPLKETADGVILNVRAQPAARKNGIAGLHDGALKIAVTQAAEKGKANKAIIQALASALNLRRSQIELLSGQTLSQKRFLVREIDAETLEQKIAAALESLH